MPGFEYPFTQWIFEYEKRIWDQLLRLLLVAALHVDAYRSYTAASREKAGRTDELFKS